MKLVMKYVIVFWLRRIKSALRGGPQSLASAMACDGQTSEVELNVLARYAKTVPAGKRIVEVGSFRGRSTVALGLGAGEEVEIVSVDPYLPIESHVKGKVVVFGPRDRVICVTNLMLAGLLQKVRMVNCPSEAAARAFSLDDHIGMVFIDGDHTYEGVVRDFEAWWPAMASGGCVLFHDSVNTHENWGVHRLMAELKTRKDLEYVETVDSISVFRKKQGGGR
jgi:predicted O-methyltransferase YrrM